MYNLFGFCRANKEILTLGYLTSSTEVGLLPYNCIFFRAEEGWISIVMSCQLKGVIIKTYTCWAGKMNNPTTYLASWQPPRSLRTTNFWPFIWKCKLFCTPHGNLALLLVWIAFCVQKIPLETYLETEVKWALRGRTHERSCLRSMLTGLVLCVKGCMWRLNTERKEKR